MNIEIITKEFDKKITIMDFHNIYYYTLENEGVEIGVDNGLIMKIDLNNNFDFLNN